MDGRDTGAVPSEPQRDADPNEEYPSDDDLAVVADHARVCSTCAQFRWSEMACLASTFVMKWVTLTLSAYAVQNPTKNFPRARTSCAVHKFVDSPSTEYAGYCGKVCAIL